MWKMHEIREMINLFEESSLQELEIEWEEGDAKISLKKQGNTFLPGYQVLESSQPVPFKPVAVPVSAPASVIPVEKEISKSPVQLASVEAKMAKQQKPTDADDPTLLKIVSPMVGTFYRAPGEDAGPYVSPGDKVEKTTIVCIVEAMKLFNEIEAEVKGEIVNVLVENGQLVEHGQPLFLVRPE